MNEMEKEIVNNDEQYLENKCKRYLSLNDRCSLLFFRSQLNFLFMKVNLFSFTYIKISNLFLESDKITNCRIKQIRRRYDKADIAYNISEC